MAGMSRMLRSSGAVSGVLLILLGAWGALGPLVGPYFHYAYTPDTAWHFTLPRLWLEIVPGAAAVLGGALVIVSTRRLLAGGGAILAALGGGWFIAGRAVNRLWPHLGVPGAPVGTSVTRVVLEELSFFTGLGAVIMFFAALALGRCSAAASPADSLPGSAGTDQDATSSSPASTADSSQAPAPPLPRRRRRLTGRVKTPPGDATPAGTDPAGGP
jgi:hypothetical protein